MQKLFKIYTKEKLNAKVTDKEKEIILQIFLITYIHTKTVMKIKL